MADEYPVYDPWSDPANQRPAGRYNTVPGWMNPDAAPDPSHPYYAQWLAANPGYVASTPTPNPTPNPPPGPSTPPPTVSDDLSYDEALAHANKTAGSVWGRALGGGDIDKMKAALGFNPGGRVAKSALAAIDSWINANKPSAGPLVPPGGNYDVPPPQSPGGGGGYPGGPWQPPNYQKPPPFEFDPYQAATPFKAPTAADLLQDPSYEFRFGQGLKAVEADKAARGVLNSGGTAKDLLGYGQDFASQEYKNVFDRDLTTYNTNEGNRFQTYATNYGLASDKYAKNAESQYNTPYSNAYKATQDQFSNNFDVFKNNQNQAQTSYANNFNSWLQSYNIWRQTQNDAFDKKYKLAQG